MLIFSPRPHTGRLPGPSKTRGSGDVCWRQEDHVTCEGSMQSMGVCAQRPSKKWIRGPAMVLAWPGSSRSARGRPLAPKRPCHVRRKHRRRWHGAPNERQSGYEDPPWYSHGQDWIWRNHGEGRLEDGIRGWFWGTPCRRGCIGDSLSSGRMSNGGIHFHEYSASRKGTEHSWERTAVCKVII
jgi:hypothetical protein